MPLLYGSGFGRKPVFWTRQRLRIWREASAMLARGGAASLFGLVLALLVASLPEENDPRARPGPSRAQAAISQADQASPLHRAPVPRNEARVAIEWSNTSLFSDTLEQEAVSQAGIQDLALLSPVVFDARATLPQPAQPQAELLVTNSLAEEKQLKPQTRFSSAQIEISPRPPAPIKRLALAKARLAAKRAEGPQAWPVMLVKNPDIAEGGLIRSGETILRLSGIRLPSADAMCRMLSGRMEPCLTRAATQLELIARWRVLECRVRPGHEPIREAQCRVGTLDLAEHLVKRGFASRMEDDAPLQDRIERQAGLAMPAGI